MTLSDAPQDLRPGLSTTAKITTATRSNALSVPIQALTLRTKEQIDQQNNRSGFGTCGGTCEGSCIQIQER